MQKFDIVTIRLFVAIVRAGSINEAARREHIATSAVSRRIGELEAMLGVKLLRRLPRGVEPTEEGEIFARYGEKLLGDLNHLSNELRDFNVGEKGKIYLAAVTSAILTGLPNFLADFERDFPDITVDVRELTSRESAEAVREGRADLAILADNSPRGDLKHDVFCDDPIWVVTPKGHPLISDDTNPKPVKFSDAAKYDIISLHEGGVIDDLISEAASKLKLDMHPHIKVVRFGSLRQMIAAGLGIGFLRKSSVAGYVGHMNISGAPIADDWAKRQLLIAHEGDENLTSSARTFRDYLLKKSAETKFKPVLG
ncbi:MULTISPECIES: LysR family transcriptional regulator [Thalassospira]|jgi:DNA-binding transcriptional LysR family regulator|uniref:LysR family transcriptional regulator n=2 Tax=Thalassospira TaxID=168934 RepID=A0A358HRK5_9PROT|nr:MULTISPECIES: LysR family transcriptional regulator [Thalassospira]PKR59026.1 LysR family transcriptional regulator [Thalassospira lohafexi]HBU97815.1 LysR family transcriptional regulator [Thalassospira lucentensis]HCW66756.1 LysR family transcriptional regulator [Thalassospira lucentensis]|tara:strand:+ start:128157 stop:129089 length:933 start_codon:yes stop_codon:yes gene_type:complete